MHLENYTRAQLETILTEIAKYFRNRNMMNKNGYIHRDLIGDLQELALSRGKLLTVHCSMITTEEISRCIANTSHDYQIININNGEIEKLKNVLVTYIPAYLTGVTAFL